MDALLAEAIHLQRQGRTAQAEHLYQALVAAEPTSPIFLNGYGILCAQMGNYPRAEALFREAMRQAPDFMDAQMNLGNLLLASGDFQEGITLLGSVAALRPDRADGLYNFGRALAASGNSSEAIAQFRQALLAEPGYLPARLELANHLRRQKNYPDAESQYRSALTQAPQHFGIYLNLALLFQDQGRFPEAEESLLAASELAPDRPEVWNNLSALYLRLSRLEDAERTGLLAIGKGPTQTDSYHNLGQLFALKGDATQAGQMFERESALARSSPRPLLALLQLALSQGQHESALEIERRLASLKGDQRFWFPDVFRLHQEICLWEDFQHLQAAAADYVKGAAIGEKPRVDPFVALSLEDLTPVDLRRFTESFVKKKYSPLYSAQFAHDPASSSSKRLRIGYLSADFHDHATAYLVAELFELHDKQVFELFAYALDPNDPGAMRTRLRAAFDHWRDIALLSNREAARIIYSDQIDILVDLKGYTKSARPEILALRPAPIQVNFLGFPGTMGAPFMDYLIADPFVIPEVSRKFYTEAIAYLPHSYQPNDRQRAYDKNISRRDLNLPEQGLILCCFNANYKITPRVFDSWCRILLSVPNSLLWLLESNPLAKSNLFNAAAHRGIGPERLIFAPKVALKDHLSRLQLADLALDTFAYNAHTTASDALWVGVPVVTLAGETFASRVAGSLLRSVGLEQLITYSVPDYEHLAIRLCKHPDELSAISSGLRTNRLHYPLFDSPSFTKDLESLYRKMVEGHRTKTPPSPIFA